MKNRETLQRLREDCQRARERYHRAEHGSSLDVARANYTEARSRWLLAATEEISRQLDESSG